MVMKPHVYHLLALSLFPDFPTTSVMTAWRVGCKRNSSERRIVYVYHVNLDDVLHSGLHRHERPFVPGVSTPLKANSSLPVRPFVRRRIRIGRSDTSVFGNRVAAGPQKNPGRRAGCAESAGQRTRVHIFSVAFRSNAKAGHLHGNFLDCTTCIPFPSAKLLVLHLRLAVTLLLAQNKLF